MDGRDTSLMKAEWELEGSPDSPHPVTFLYGSWCRRTKRPPESISVKTCDFNSVTHKSGQIFVVLVLKVREIPS